MEGVDVQDPAERSTLSIFSQSQHAPVAHATWHVCLIWDTRRVRRVVHQSRD